MPLQNLNYNIIMANLTELKKELLADGVIDAAEVKTIRVSSLSF